jgi:hypothetical protein
MGCDDEAEATKWTGEALVAPGAGELMVTPANAIAEVPNKAERRTAQRLIAVLNI